MQFLYRLVGFDPTKHNLRTELLAGLTTFLTMGYILAVNPDILANTGMDKGAVFTATALASAIGTLLIAFMAKLPFAQAPGMGINAFFAFTLCLTMGYSWQQSLAAVFIEGLIFIVLTAFNIREQIVPFSTASSSAPSSVFLWELPKLVLTSLPSVCHTASLPLSCKWTSAKC